MKIKKDGVYKRRGMQTFKYSLMLSGSPEIVFQSDSLDECMKNFTTGYVIRKNKEILAGFNFILEWHGWFGLHLTKENGFILDVGFLSFGMENRIIMSPDKVIYPPHEV